LKFYGELLVLKYIILQYVRQEEYKLKVYLQKYFSELASLSLFLVKAKLIFELLFILMFGSIYLTINTDAVYTIDIFNLNLTNNNSKITLYVVFTIVSTILIMLIKKIQVTSLVKKEYAKLKFLYKCVFGINHLISLILIFIIATKFLNVTVLIILLLLIIVNLFISKDYLIKAIIITCLFILTIQLYNFFDLKLKYEHILTFTVLTTSIYLYRLRFKDLDFKLYSQKFIFSKIIGSNQNLRLNIPISFVLVHNVMISLPSMIPLKITDVQLLSYLVFIYLISIIYLQIKNPILINLDWYGSFISYISKSKNGERKLLEVLEYNNLKLIFFLTSLVIIECVFIYHMFIWWIFPISFLIWNIDNTFSLFSFKILSITQRENIRQHSNKQLPYVILSGCCLPLIVNKSISDIDVNILIVFIIYIILMIVVMLVKREGRVEFKKRTKEKNYE
jgi:hypothetical protein